MKLLIYCFFSFLLLPPCHAQFGGLLDALKEVAEPREAEQKKKKQSIAASLTTKFEFRMSHTLRGM